MSTQTERERLNLIIFLRRYFSTIAVAWLLILPAVLFAMALINEASEAAPVIQQAAFGFIGLVLGPVIAAIVTSVLQVGAGAE